MKEAVGQTQRVRHPGGITLADKGGCAALGTSRKGRRLSHNGDMIRYEAFLAEGTPQRARRMHQGERGQLDSVLRYQRGQTISRESSSCLVRNPAFILSAAGQGQGGGSC